ncbi:peptide chain release factor N(5)-glutamine methyltransferase [Scopulibacillus cellulosilyticus]|uniref:Release factor glutamine methyltransferase n=1 Tax=Scopulibacillus cellulosilyticus TaxID=2665665 RepID=A0ABW2PR25_9BACL
MKIYEALKWASSFLKEHNRDENAGEYLLCHRLGMNRTELLMNIRESLSFEDQKWLREKIHEHAGGMPVQYIIGYEWFYGRKFKVSPDVLIPRPETEELVQTVLKMAEAQFPKGMTLKVCDIGTGSGAIAVSLALENIDMDVYAVDISKEALAVAKENAKNLSADVHFVNGSFLEPFLGNQTFDIIVSNPPYITEKELIGLETVVKDYEPVLALSGGADGLDCYREIIRQIPQAAASKLILAFEIGFEQGGPLSELLTSAFGSRLRSLSVQKDINGKDRMVFAVIERD